MKISPLARAISPLAEEVAVLIWSAWTDDPIAARAFYISEQGSFPAEHGAATADDAGTTLDDGGTTAR